MFAVARIRKSRRFSGAKTEFAPEHASLSRLLWWAVEPQLHLKQVNVRHHLLRQRKLIFPPSILTSRLSSHGYVMAQQRGQRPLCRRQSCRRKLAGRENWMNNSTSASLVQQNSKDAQSVEDPWLGVDGRVCGCGPGGLSRGNPGHIPDGCQTELGEARWRSASQRPQTEEFRSASWLLQLSVVIGSTVT